MRKIILTAFIILMVSAAFAGDFKITVHGIKDGIFPNRYVFSSFGCSGGNVSPEVTWENPPEGTKSFVLTVYDPDAPTGSGWWHWIVADIPASVGGLAEGAGNNEKMLPKGAYSIRTDYGKPGYGGPCPPPGPSHRYIFTVYAMKIDRLGVPADSSGALAGFMTRANAIDHAETVVRYGR